MRMKTRQHYQRKCTRRSVDVVAGVRFVRCHSCFDVVIDVRVIECYASMDVVIGVRIMLCHPHRFSTFLDFHIVPKFSSCCHAVAIHHNFCLHVLHRGNTSFEVWYLHSTSVTVDRRQL